MVSLRIIIAVVAFSAIVVLGQEKEKEQKVVKGGDDAKLLFNLGTRTFVFMSTQVVTRWSTCLQGSPGADAAGGVTNCQGKRRRRSLSPKSPQLEAIGDLAASDLASSVDTESKVIENDKGKLGFFNSVSTTITITSTSIDTATTVSVSIECQTNPASTFGACTG